MISFMFQPDDKAAKEIGAFSQEINSLTVSSLYCLSRITIDSLCYSSVELSWFTITLPMQRLLSSKTQGQGANIFENHLNSVMLVFIG